MAALLTYRSRNSFESRFGRNVPDPSKRQWIREQPALNSIEETHFHIHNDGHKVNHTSPRRSLSRQDTDASDLEQLSRQQRCGAKASPNGGIVNGKEKVEVDLGGSNLDPSSMALRSRWWLVREAWW